uniref:Lysophospholipase n=1 Tax=Caulobacter sp. (strain K31) TaxID=366602 RepID=B0SXQ8_CAUSK
MSRKPWAALGLVMGLGLSMAACAQPAPAAAPIPNDYTKDENWLCRPGRQDACAADQTATVIAADGKTTVEAFKPDPDAPIDCFYVYPTVSSDPGGNSDMTPDLPEKAVADQQFARFGQVCKLYAPSYRQVTIAALRKMMMGQASGGDGELAYADVLAAWKDYLARDNHGRGVVLIGHSQGSRILLKLIAQEIDGKPAQKQLVSALILGMNTPVDPTKDSYGSLPLCRAAGQTGCVISYVSFRADVPPPTGSKFFGKVAEPGMKAACVNPAALAGGSATVRSYFSDRTIMGTAMRPATVWAKDVTVATPYVALPGLVSAECVSKDGFDYLAVTVHPDKADPRADNIPGDLLVLGQPLKDWGLHLVDVNLTMGDLVAVVGEQSKAYSAK